MIVFKAMEKLNDMMIAVSHRDPVKLAVVVFVFFIVEQLCSRVIEQIFWGDRFYHPVDLLALIILFSWYVFLCWKICEKLSAISGMEDVNVFTVYDKKSGVQYIATSLGGITPRLQENGNPMIRSTDEDDL